MPNRLAHESSPYLQQHKDNPVDWHPWSDEALSRARMENKPILLSIGYSACHWCHVMAHESFENDAIARQLNENFISIKVDREERPDIDSIYMNALQAMTGHGGWPLNIFLTPDAVPFFGGTYWPPADRQGMPGFPHVLEAIESQWTSNRAGIDNTARQIHDYLQQASAALPMASPSDAESTAEAALSTLLPKLDPILGGLNGAPRFPQASMLEFLLRNHARTRSEATRTAFTQALDGMANGGIHDQLGGGFSRYSVDDRWLVPHFEKMLYDNAQLLSLYVDGFQLTGSPRYRQVASETAEWLLRDMQDHAGGFYAALDADSEGEEGRFYVWTETDIDRVLSPEAADLVRLHFGVIAEGNFEGRNVLHIARSVPDLARTLERSPESVQREIDAARTKLLAERETRPPPGTDTKIVISWNGLAIGALAKAGLTLRQPHFVEAAVRAADRILDHALTPDGQLARLVTPGGGAGNGLLEDYAYLAWGVLELHTATGAFGYLETARRLADTVLASFRADTGFFDTGTAHEALIVRPRDIQDGATPSGNSVMLDVLFTLGHLRGDERYTAPLDPYLNALARPMAEHPAMFGRALAVLERTIADARHVVLVGEDASSLLAETAASYLPFVTVVWTAPDDLSERWPTISGHWLPHEAPVAAFVCQGNTCLPPITDPGHLIATLEAASRSGG